MRVLKSLDTMTVMSTLFHARYLLNLGLLLGLFAGSPAHGQEPDAAQEQRPNVLLITIDTLRPDALGWVAGRNPTPHIDALAEAGYRFPGAISPLPLTQPAHASMLTGLYPRRHGIRSNGRVLSPQIPTLGERLRDVGYDTAAFVSGFPLAAEGGLDRGFDHYDDTLPVTGRGAGTHARGVERRADDTVTAALRWLETASQPWFVWIHFYDPHDPYEPPEPWRGQGPRAAYDGEVRAVDAAIGRLLGDLGPAPRLTVLTSDHGESLGEHGEETHGFFIYESTMAVPLVIHWPGRVPAGQSAAAVRLVDLGPTVLDLLGLPPLDDVDGFSLWPLMHGKAWLTPDAYLESQRPWLSYGWAPLRALRRGDWKLIAAPQPELYDLAKDSSETTNLVQQERRLAQDLAASLRAVEARPVVRGGLVDDPEALARLRSLGYTGSGASDVDASPDAVDPKLRIAQWHLLGEAQRALDAGRLDDALLRFDQVLKADPDNPFALGRSGAALASAGRLDDALPRLRRVIELRPQDHEARAALARAATRASQLPEALGHWMELTRRRPRRADHWANLASTFGLSGSPDKAVEAFGQALDLEPENADLLIQLAFAQFAAKQPEASMKTFLRAAELTGPSAFPHAGALGILLMKAGRADDARPWLERVTRQDGDYAEARFQLARLLARRGEASAARKALRDVLAVQPAWRHRAANDDVLKTLLESP